MRRPLLCRLGLHAKVAEPDTGLLVSHRLMCRRANCRARWYVLSTRDDVAVLRIADA
jgi:hypothetical protein